ncbi:hypothetical protein QR680_000513 [Steinernema hermaphroditum]|uniref:Uncharacterized protein n=1 Tax=Steinernema hermaphroditum TaxID=289476 RepID=A0AA39LDQ1_9BILA|nr:hypothetical protein QR680_000513 [Steinernema hermaphroditum]
MDYLFEFLGVCAVLAMFIIVLCCFYWDSRRPIPAVAPAVVAAPAPAPVRNNNNAPRTQQPRSVRFNLD